MSNQRSGTAMASVSPFFIVRDVSRSLAFYRDELGFEATFRSPEDDPFFAVIRRDGIQLLIKAVGVEPLPNVRRHPDAKWDAFVLAPDPDALAAEFAGRGATLRAPLADSDDGLRGFELEDPDGYVLFFGRPVVA